MMRMLARAALALLTGVLLTVGCAPSGTPGVKGEVVLDDNFLVNVNYATRVFIGGYTDAQLASDGWPARWGDAGYSTTIDNINAKPYTYEIVTGSGGRLHMFAFLDQNGEIAGNSTTEPDVLTQDGTPVPDLIGAYAKNPVVPIDDILERIDIVLNVEMR